MSEKRFPMPLSSLEGLKIPQTYWDDLAYFVSLSNRTMWIIDDIDESTLEVMKYIVLWNEEDAKGKIPLEQRKPIRLKIFSHGGDADVGDSMYELIKSSETKVIAYNMGLVASAAFDIYIACDERITYPGSKFLVHEGSMRVSGQNSSVENYTDMSKKTKARMIDRIAEQTNLSVKTLKGKIASDWWFFGEEAIKLGVAHRLWTHEDFALKTIWKKGARASFSAILIICYFFNFFSHYK